jgi:hypothetical protein
MEDKAKKTKTKMEDDLKKNENGRQHIKKGRQPKKK